MTDVVVIGAGAAGLFTAIQACSMGLEVLVLEKNAKPGLKILVSGGGRCNFTNLGANAEHYRSQNPHFCKASLARFSPQDALAHFEAIGIRPVEKKPGQLFCQQGARFFLDALLRQLEDLGGRCLTQMEVQNVSHDGQNFAIQTRAGQAFEARAVVIANGGLSWPKLGANGSGYAIAKSFGHRVTPTSPGLVPLLWPKELQTMGELSGCAADVHLKVLRDQRCIFEDRDDILITHQGISGPVVLQASNHWERNDAIHINWLPKIQIESLVQAQPDRSLRKTLEAQLPKRLVSTCVPEPLLQLKGRQVGPRELESLRHLLQDWSFTPRDQAGFSKAEVTLGGVQTDQVSSKTLESDCQKGLYLVGEVLDVTGQLGGYNFQWAWSSGYSAAIAIAESLWSRET